MDKYWVHESFLHEDKPTEENMQGIVKVVIIDDLFDRFGERLSGFVDEMIEEEDEG